MNKLLIENKGEIDVNALILMGGSTKRDSGTAIGFFGSGNKYSIALLLKNDIPFRIYSGLREIVITTENVGFRDKSFKQILINGDRTSLTTDMGPQWDNWMAIREFVSNSIDEGESNIISNAKDENAREGYTRIYIDHHPEVESVIKEWNKYFSFDRIDSVLETENGKVFTQIDTEKESLLLYRKGIQCYALKSQKALYNYDLPTFKINESRVLSDTWDARRDVCKFLSQHATVQIATNILGNAFVHEYYEGTVEWSYWATHVLNQHWRTAIGDRIIVNNDAGGFYMKEMSENKHYRVSRSMAKAIKVTFADVTVYGIGQDDEDTLNWREIEQTPKIQYMLKKAIEFCQETKYVINYDIKVVEFDKVETMGCAYQNTIYIAGTTFDRGMKELVMTMIEENEHLKTGYKDETREWATHWIQMYLTSKEEAHGIFL